MRTSLRRAIVGASALAIAGSALAIAGGAAQAAVTPGWQPDANNAGGLYFYDASGHQITSGSITDSPMAAYYVPSGGAIVSGNNKAFEATATPVQSANSATWASIQTITGAQTFSPAPVYPGDLAGFTGAAVHGVSTDGSLSSNQIAAFPNGSAVSGYQGLYEVRVYTTDTTNGPSSTWYDAVVQVSGTTWTQVWPVQTSTTTTLTAPASVVSGSNATLNATVAPASAGKVNFFEGATLLGSQTVAGGTASFTVTAPALGSHTYSAVFVPTPGTANLGSTSNTATTNVVAPSNPTTTGLAVTGLPANGGDTLTYTATVSPAAAPGTVSFFDGASLIGTTPAGAGTFVLTNNSLGAGPHSVTAVFNPTNPASFQTSTSSPQAFTLGAPVCSGTSSVAGGTTCTDVQSIQADIAAGTLVVSTPYSSTNVLDVPLALDPTASFFTGQAGFNAIQVTDTRAGNLPWTLKAQASSLTNGASSINGQNVGLTTFTVVGTPTVNASAANLTVTNNPAAAPPVAPGDPGTLGLGNAAHTVAHANQGEGTIQWNAVLTINAPTNLPAGTYAGTITFTTG